MLLRIGEIVRAARERSELSQMDLAQRSGARFDVLVALERGEGGITTVELDDVARALSLDPVALMRGAEVPRCMPSVFLRHNPVQDFDHRDGGAFDDALEQGRSLASLRATLGEHPLALQAEVFRQREAAADSQDAPAQDGYRLAQEVRQWLGEPAEPLGDLRALLEQKFGIAVVVRRLESLRVTASAIRSGNAAAVVLNARDPLRARYPLITRVHLAHELCHALFDPSPGGLHIVVDLDVDRKVKAAEQRANAFAAEFLLPRRGLVQLLGEPAKARVSGTNASLDVVTRVRGRFGTPHEIAVNHLCNREFLDRGLRVALNAAGSTFLGTPPQTTLPADEAASRLVAAMAERAHHEGMVTDGEVRGILGIDRLAPLPWDEVSL